jgi:hypothetical protein
MKGEHLPPTPKKRMTYRLIGLGQFFLLSFRDQGGELLHPKRLPHRLSRRSPPLRLSSASRDGREGTQLPLARSPPG